MGFPREKGLESRANSKLFEQNKGIFHSKCEEDAYFFYSLCSKIRRVAECLGAHLTPPPPHWRFAPAWAYSRVGAVTVVASGLAVKWTSALQYRQTRQ